jgi:hypothetical protein
MERFRASALIVEEITPERAIVAYGVEAVGSGQDIFAREAVRTTARVLPNGSLRFGAAPVVLTFTITDDLRSLHGTHETSGRLDGEATMRRCERTLRAPTE